MKLLANLKAALPRGASFVQMTVGLALLATGLPTSSAAEAPTDATAIRRWEALGYGMYIHHQLAKALQGESGADSPSMAKSIQQWVRTAKEAHMKFVVLVVKHEDGYCLWDSKDYDYDVGAVRTKPALLETFVLACQQEKLLPGIHYSVGDHHNEAGDIFKPPVSRLYFEFVLKQTRELHTQYPQIGFQLFDLAHRLSPGQRRQLYDEVQRLNPKCIVLLGGYTDFTGRSWIHQGPDPGLEANAYIPRVVIASVLGDAWGWSPSCHTVPAERLLEIYAASRQNNANFLLNVGPDDLGEIPQDQHETLARLAGLITLSRDGLAAGVPPGDYFPLAQGAVREFLVEKSSPGPSKARQVQTGKLITRCDGKEIINNQEYYRCPIMKVGFPEWPDGVSYLRRGGEGIYIIEDTKDRPERLHLALPPVLGKRWETKIGKVSYSSWIEGVETTDVYKGKYENCLKMRMQLKDLEGKVISDVTTYLAKGVGPVKSVVRSGEVAIKMSLEKSSLK